MLTACRRHRAHDASDAPDERWPTMRHVGAYMRNPAENIKRPNVQIKTAWTFRQGGNPGASWVAVRPGQAMPYSR